MSSGVGFSIIFSLSSRIDAVQTPIEDMTSELSAILN
jgi:hypothetical protein